MKFQFMSLYISLILVFREKSKLFYACFVDVSSTFAFRQVKNHKIYILIAGSKAVLTWKV